MMGQRWFCVGPTLAQCWANVSLICVCGFYVQPALTGLTNIFLVLCLEAIHVSYIAHRSWFLIMVY